MTQISYFPTVKTIRPVHVDVLPILKGIKDCQIKAQIDAIRAAEPKEQEKLKGNLPGVTFGGTFKKREMKGLVAASGLLCLDFDVEGYVCPDSLLPFVYSSFRSPRGGLKIVVRIPVVENDAQFKAIFRSLEAEFPDTDPSSKDISRICFLSADPDLYLNESAQVWEKRIEELAKPSLSMELATSRQGAPQSNWSKIALGLKMIKSSQVGNRHTNALKAGRLMGGYIATGEINDDDIAVLVREIEATSTEPKDHVRAFLDGVANGKALPLRSDKRGVEDVYKVRKAIKEEWKASDSMGNIAYGLDDPEINDTINGNWEKGNVRGVTTGWPSLDGLFSILPGYMTIIYGAPTMGKSLWTMNLLMNLAIEHDWFHCLFTPEMGTPDEVYQTLIQIYVGRDVTNTYGNRMTKEQLTAAKKFVGDHFIILDNEESGDEIEMETLMLYVDYLERKLNKKIHTVTVDPLVELMLMTNEMRDDIYWNFELKKGRSMSKQGQRHLFLIHHTKDPGRPAGRDGYGNLIWPQPSPHDIAFGQIFYRKAFFLINVWYHYAEGVPIGDTIELKPIGRVARSGYSYIKIVKAKPEGAGMRGEVELRFSRAEHRFYDENSMPVVERTPARDFTQSQTSLTLENKYEKSPDDEDPSWLKDETESDLIGKD